MRQQVSFFRGLPVPALHGFLLLLGLALPARAADSAQQRELEEMAKALREAMPQLEQAMKTLKPATVAPGISDLDVLPARRDLQLARLPKTPLSPAALKAHIATVVQKIPQALNDRSRQRVNDTLRRLRDRQATFWEFRAVANGLAAAGFLPEASLVMAQTALGGGQAEDLNNLAAFLLMLDAAPAALPILEALAARYPSNSTVLNNLGLGYYQLGDHPRAEKILLRAIAGNRGHPQASVTAAQIARSRGEHARAADLLAQANDAIWSPSKDALLRKVGGKPVKQAGLRLPGAKDALGLMQLPGGFYPMSFDDWVATLPMIQSITATSETEANALAAKAAAIPPAEPSLKEVLGRQLSEAAALRLNAQVEEDRVHQNRLLKALASWGRFNAAEQEKMDRAIAAIDAAGQEKYKNRAGGYQFDYTCEEVKRVVDKYLSTVGPDLKNLETEQWQRERRTQTQVMELTQFVAAENDFERAKLELKATTLRRAGKSGMPYPAYIEQRRAACVKKEPSPIRSVKLPHFEDIHCASAAKFDIPFIGSMEFTCRGSSAKFDADFSPVKYSIDMSDRDDGSSYISRASVEVSNDAGKISAGSEFDESGWKSGSIGVEAGVGESKGRTGPMEIKIGGTVSGTLEFDRGGLTNVSLGGNVEGSASATEAQTAAGHLQGGIKGQVGSSWSWNAGPSGSASGAFNGSVFDL